MTYTHFDYFLSQFPVSAAYFSYVAQECIGKDSRAVTTALLHNPDPEHKEAQNSIIDALGRYFRLPQNVASDVVLFRALDMLSLFVGEGKQVFQLGRTMSNMLLDTSLDGIDPSNIVLPYACSYVALPPVWSFYQGSEEFVVNGAYVYNVRVKSGCERLDAVRVALWAKGAKEWAQLSETITREDMVSKDYARDLPIDDDRLNTIQVRELLSNLTHIVANLCLYLSSGERSLREGGDYARLKKRLAKAKGKKEKKLKRRLSMTCRITEVFPEAERYTYVKPLEEAGGTVKYHHRRGHWHHYWVGKRRTCPETGRRIGARLEKRLVPGTWCGDPKNGVSHRLHYLPHPPKAEKGC